MNRLTLAIAAAVIATPAMALDPINADGVPPQVLRNVLEVCKAKVNNLTDYSATSACVWYQIENWKQLNQIEQKAKK